MKKIDLNTILLYLENKLSKEKSEEISNYLLTNKNILDYVLSLSKIKAYTEINPNHIRFEIVNDILTTFYSGMVSLLEEQQLSFRNTTKSYHYKYSFMNKDITLIKQDHIFLFYIQQDSNHQYELINQYGDPIIMDLHQHYYQTTLDVNQTYYLFIHQNNTKELLELKL